MGDLERNTAAYWAEQLNQVTLPSLPTCNNHGSMHMASPDNIVSFPPFSRTAIGEFYLLVLNIGRVGGAHRHMLVSMKCIL